MPPMAPRTLLATLETAGARIMTKVQPPHRAGRAVRQGPLRYRPDSQAPSPAPGTVSAPIRPGHGRRRGRRVRRRLRRLPAGRRSAPPPPPAASSRSAPTSTSWPAPAQRQADPAWRADYTGHSAQGGTQDRAPDAPPPRRPPCPRPRQAPRSPPTSLCLPPRSTWPVSACLDYVKPPAKGGRSHRCDRKTPAGQLIPQDRRQLNQRADASNDP